MAVIQPVRLFLLLAALSIMYAQASFARAASAPAAAPQGAARAVYVRDDGHVLVRGARVTNLGTNALTAEVVWGATKVPWIVMTNEKTDVVQKYASKISFTDVNGGDTISFEGSLLTTAPQLTVTAGTIRDWSVVRAETSFLGTIASLDAGANTFTFMTQEKGTLTVRVSGVTDISGAPTSTFAGLNQGMRVQVSGSWDVEKKTLAAERIKVYVNPQAMRTTFEGVLKSVSAPGVRTSIIVTINGNDFTVTISGNTSFLNSAWRNAKITDMKPGDTIRIYGVAQGDTIDSLVVRDTSLK